MCHILGFATVKSILYFTGSKCLTLLVEIHPINNVKVLKAVDSYIWVQVSEHIFITYLFNQKAWNLETVGLKVFSNTLSDLILRIIQWMGMAGMNTSSLTNMEIKIQT